MKKETLQARIKKHLYTKGGKLARKYEAVIELLNNPERVMRPIYWGYKGRTLHDCSANLECGLHALGIDYETGNDAPRGGKNGYFVKRPQRAAAKWQTTTRRNNNNNNNN